MRKNKNRCRICGSNFFTEPLLVLDNMPKSAQYLPSYNKIETDKGICLKIYQCKDCGVVQHNNNPVDYYKEVIRATGLSKELRTQRKIQFESFIKKYKLYGKKIIEIGCSEGDNLKILKKLNVTPSGIEFSNDAVDKCKEAGLNVQKNFINSKNKILKGRPFDGFIIMNFLEHIPDPNIFLKGLYNNLRKSSVGIIEVPNFDMILEKNLFSEFVSDHIFYFTKKTLSSLIMRNGFEIVDHKILWNKYILSVVVRKCNPISFDAIKEKKDKVCGQINKFILSFQKDDIAIWGASHQALALINMTNLSKKVKYVVDSAPFKQGKYTPASHIAIVNPTTLISDPVKAVIIIAAGYNNEIIQLIKKTLKEKVKIAVIEKSELIILEGY